jgi:nitrogen fixation NifU-like protein
VFSATLLDRFYDPRHMGDVDAPSAAATEGNPTCGDVVRIGLEVVDGEIRTARFRTLGCAVAIAASDAVCELVDGQSPIAARYLNLDEVVAALGGIPPGRESCASAPLLALRSALGSLPSAGTWDAAGPRAGAGDLASDAGQTEASRPA